MPPAIAEEVAQARRSHLKVGFVPTMGALHRGHLSLIERARQSCDLVICSIFVNPLQFNDQTDLARYPRTIKEDSTLLEEAGCNILFTPEKEDIFTDFQPFKYDLGGLDRNWEGPSRPGHFQGVVNVVERLFFYVRPDEAFFGEKDRQQLTILSHVARTKRWPEKIIACPTTREADGLALSSRNLRLSPEDRGKASLLYKALTYALEKAFHFPIRSIISHIEEMFDAIPDVQLDHFGIADQTTLEPLADWEDRTIAIALIAAQVGPVRLIDNLTLARKPRPIDPTS